MPISPTAFRPSDLDGDEATRRGYRRTSNKYRLVARIDRPDWLARLARKVGCSVAELYDPATGLPAAHWCDHYRRTLSHDILQLTEAAFRLVPQSSGNTTGYVDLTAPAWMPLARHATGDGSAELSRGVINRLLDDSETLLMARTSRTDRPPEELARDALVFWNHPTRNTIETHVARVAAALQAERDRSCCRCGDQKRTQASLAAERDEARLLVQQLVRPVGVPAWPEVAALAQTVLNEGPSNLPHLVSQATAERDKVREEYDEAQEELEIAQEDRNEARNLVRRLTGAPSDQSWLEVAAYAGVAKTVPEADRALAWATQRHRAQNLARDWDEAHLEQAVRKLTGAAGEILTLPQLITQRTRERDEAQALLQRVVGADWPAVLAGAQALPTLRGLEDQLAKAHRCQDEIMRDRDWYEAHLENLRRDHAVATRGWRLREVKLMADGARADELAKERLKSVLLEAYGALEVLLRNQQLDRFTKGHHAWKRLHIHLAPEVPLPEFRVPSGKPEAGQDLAVAREQTKKALLERDRLRDALIKLRRWFNPGELAVKEIEVALEYRSGAVATPPADLEADLRRVMEAVSPQEGAAGHPLVAEWKTVPSGGWRADLLNDVALRMWRNRDGWFRSSILLAQRGDPGLAQLEAERVARAASLLRVDPLYALRQARTALLKMPESGGGVLSGTDRGLLLARIEAALAGR